MPREQATEHKTMITPDNPTTDLACIRFEAHLSWSLPRVRETYLGVGKIQYSEFLVVVGVIVLEVSVVECKTNFDLS